MKTLLFLDQPKNLQKFYKICSSGLLAVVGGNGLTSYTIASIFSHFLTGQSMFSKKIAYCGNGSKPTNEPLTGQLVDALMTHFSFSNTGSHTNRITIFQSFFIFNFS